MNVFDLAMQMELDGKDHYEKLSAAAPSTDLKRIFSMLAASEMKHYHAFKSIKMEEPMEMAGFSDLCADLVQMNGFFLGLKIDDELLGNLKTTQDALRHAMIVEQDSIRLYEDIVKTQQHHICNSEAVPVLLKIVEEEKKHYDLVENIHQIIDKYQHFQVIHKFGTHRDI